MFLDFLARLDKLDRFHTANLVTKEVANGSLENLVHQVFHGTDHGNNAWSLCIRNVNENLQIDAEHEALIAFGNDGLKARIKPMSSCHVLRPIELENCRENELRVVNPGIDRVLSRSQRFLPDALVARANQAAELEVCAGCILCGQSYISLDNGDLTLFHNQHRHLFHANQERVEVVSAIEQRVMLQADLPASLQELLEILIVVMLIVFAAKDQPHQLEISDARFRFELTDVFESAQPAGNSARR